MASDKHSTETIDYGVYMFGDWTLNSVTNQLTQGDKVQSIEHRHSMLLRLFITSRNQVLTRDDIFCAVWPRKVVNDESIAVAVSQLRKLLNDDARVPRYIKTVPGVGYQFIAHSTSESKVLPDTRLNHTASFITPIIAAITRPFMWTLAALIIAALTIGPTQQATPINIPDIPNNDSLTLATNLTQTGQEANLRRAVMILRDLLIRNPNDAKAWLGLAEAKMKLLGEKQMEIDSYHETLTLLRKALAIDPTLARAHLWIAHLLMWHDGNFSEAKFHFEAGLKLAPSDELIQLHYTHFLMVQRRFDEARNQIGSLRNLDPLQFSKTQMAWVYLLESNYPAAAAELERIAATEEEDEDFHRIAQNVYFHLNDEQRTFAHMQWFFKPAGFDIQKVARLNQQFTVSGMKGVYQWLLETKDAADLGQFTPPISWARYAVAINQKEIAIDYLKQAFDERHLHIQCVAADPLYQPLYNDQRFRQLISSVTL